MMKEIIRREFMRFGLFGGLLSWITPNKDEPEDNVGSKIPEVEENGCPVDYIERIKLAVEGCLENDDEFTIEFLGGSRLNFTRAKQTNFDGKLTRLFFTRIKQGLEKYIEKHRA